MKYYTYDGIVYREPEPGAHFERWNGEEWIAAAGPALAPSQEEYLRMREIPRPRPSSSCRRADAARCECLFRGRRGSLRRPSAGYRIRTKRLPGRRAGA